MPPRKYRKSVGLSFDGGPYEVAVFDHDGNLLHAQSINDLEDVVPYLYDIGSASQLSVGAKFHIHWRGAIISTATIDW